ncbi:hypothetical protein L9F63_022122, partial [Diploptera punctata]
KSVTRKMVLAMIDAKFFPKLDSGTLMTEIQAEDFFEDPELAAEITGLYVTFIKNQKRKK